MKGIILAGGNGSRLYPLTKTVSKQLLPVYDKPMIYYPLSTLMLMGIQEILIISTPNDTPNIEELLGDGSKIGISIQYDIQSEPNGIAEAFIIGEKFIDDENVCLILGDNIFYTGSQFDTSSSLSKELSDFNKATIFVYPVSDPERFGVVGFDENMNVVSIEEKPTTPKSNTVSVGLYIYPNDVVKKAKNLKPSPRGEIEITDLNNAYLDEGRISASLMSASHNWFDAGTPDSLMEASSFVQIVEKRQGLKIACIEEIALRLGYISDMQIDEIMSDLKNGDYKKYLQKIRTNYLDIK